MARYIIGLVLALFALAFVGEASAEVELYGGALSYHLETDKNLNNVNPMVFAAYDGWSGGYFYNSYRNDTYFIGKIGRIDAYDPFIIGGIAGVMKGYTREQVPFCNNQDVCLMVMPFIQYEVDDWRPTLVIGGKFFSVLVGYEF